MTKFSCKINESLICELISADIENFQAAVLGKEPTEVFEAGIVDFVKTQTQFLQSVVLFQSFDEFLDTTFSHEVLSEIKNYEGCICHQSFSKCDQTICGDLVSCQIEIIQP